MESPSKKWKTEGKQNVHSPVHCHFLNQSEVKPKPLVTCITCSCLPALDAGCSVCVFASSSD